MKTIREYLKEKILMGNKLFFNKYNDISDTKEYKRLRDILKKDDIPTERWGVIEYLTLSGNYIDIIRDKWKKINNNRYSKNGIIINIENIKGKRSVILSLYVPSKI